MAERVTVTEGQDLFTIARDKGFFRWQSIYYHELNADLRALRPDPNLLLAGDVVHIPDLEEREELCETGKEHVFQLRAEPETALHLTLEERPGIPFADVEYQLRLTVHGEERTMTGRTSPRGELTRRIPLQATAATLELWPAPGGEPLVYELGLGHMAPIDTVTGVQDRLRNLGYDLGDEDGTIGDLTKAAIARFQALAGLEATGDPDQPAATRAALEAQGQARPDARGGD